MADFNSSSLLSAVNERTLQYIPSFIDDQRREGTLDDTTSLMERIAPLVPKYLSQKVGKVRDMVIAEDIIIIITTDRQSAFDRQLTSVPCKGRVLNLLSLWWFQLSHTKIQIPNAVVASPHPNVTIARKCVVFPVEFVMRGFITGSTSTSLWTNYHKGARTYCGHVFPDGLLKNQRLDANKLTPTTKSDEHDELISAEEIVSRGLMSRTHWEQCESYAHALFQLGQEEALIHGLLLVDTKYEFGLDSDGIVRLIDEVHTPDSSRYWVAATYEDRFRAGLEPDSIDKEFLRRWYVARCDPYSADALPEAPSELVNELARRYIMIYELLTGELFEGASMDQSLPTSIEQSLRSYFLVPS